MTLKQIIPAGVLALVLAATAGCSMLRQAEGVRGDSGMSSPTAKPVTENNGSKASGKTAAGTSPRHAETDTGDGAALASVLPGEWLIVKVGNTVISQDEDMPYLTFEPSSGRFYSSNGCNILNGGYELDGTAISFRDVLSTMKYCGELEYDVLINRVVKDGVTVRAATERVGNETYIYMYDGNTQVMTLRRHNMEFLNGHWQVVTINGAAVEGEADVFFDVAELKIHGNTGCNYFNGEIYIDHSKSNAVDFSNMGVTRMACPNTRQETAMLVALEQTAAAISGDDSEVMLLDSDGNAVMTLRRIPMDMD